MIAMRAALLMAMAARPPGYVFNLRHHADHGVTVAFQINSDTGAVDDSSDLVQELDAALARLAIKALH